MAVISAEAAADYAWQAGFRGDGLATIVAIAGPESGYDTDKLGDLTLEDAKWGPSVGLVQIRSLRAEFGKGTDRDELANHDPRHNLAAAFRISGGGTNFRPWSTYDDGSYAAFLDAARSAASKVTSRGGSPDAPTVGPIASQAWSDAIKAGDDQLAPVADYTGTGFPLGASFVIRGRALSGDIDDYVIGGNVDLDVSAVWQTTLQFDDPGLVGVAKSGLLDIGTPVDYYELNLVVAGIEVGPGKAGSEQVTVTLRTAGAESMKQDRAPRTESNVSIQAFVSDEGFLHGLVPIVDNDARGDWVNLPTVARNPANSTDPTSKNESSWEVVQRLAKEAGRWCWEAGAHELMFVPPTWQVQRAVGFRVEWRTGGDPWLAPMDCPTCRRTNDDPLWLAEITVRLPPSRGRQIRPGMRMTLAGVPGFEDGYIVSKVSWNLDGGIKPVEVVAVTPRDPLPTNPQVQAATPELIAAHAGTKSALDFVNFALKQAGTRYVYGAKPELDNPHPDAFDCSELVQWAAHQVGVDVPRTSGQQYAAAKAAGTDVAVDVAYRTRGALLFLGVGGSQHVAISLGDGSSTIEARGRQYGVLVVQDITTRGFTLAGLLPGIVYNGLDAAVAADPNKTRFGRPS